MLRRQGETGSDPEGDRHPVLTRYGTTLLLAVVTGSGSSWPSWGMGHPDDPPGWQGGDPLEKDPALLGSVTHSSPPGTCRCAGTPPRIPAGGGVS